VLLSKLPVEETTLCHGTSLSGSSSLSAVEQDGVAKVSEQSFGKESYRPLPTCLECPGIPINTAICPASLQNIGFSSSPTISRAVGSHSAVRNEPHGVIYLRDLVQFPK